MEKSSLGEEEKSLFGEGAGSTLEEEEETPLKESTISCFSSISSSENFGSSFVNSFTNLEVEKLTKI
jgi:hypothetical protein